MLLQVLVIAQLTCAPSDLCDSSNPCAPAALSRTLTGAGYATTSAAVPV